MRERSQGSLERLMASPVSRLDIVLGYLFGLFVFALLQTLIIFFFTIYAFGVTYRGDLWQILIFQLVIIIGSVNLGIFTSTFACNEFQVIQFIPVIILPQVFLGGILWPAQIPSVFVGCPASHVRRKRPARHHVEWQGACECRAGFRGARWVHDSHDNPGFFELSPERRIDMFREACV